MRGAAEVKEHGVDEKLLDPGAVSKGYGTEQLHVLVTDFVENCFQIHSQQAGTHCGFEKISPLRGSLRF